MLPQIEKIITENIQVKQAIFQDEVLLNTLVQVVDLCVQVLNNGGKLLFCGNGGSAADAQHLSGELSGRFYKERKPLFAEALHVNTSFLTAVSNDYSFEEAYARMVEAMGRRGDVLFALSTSGNSSNILNAIKRAQQQGMTVVGMTGKTGGKMSELCEYTLKIPSATTPRIQEAHILLGHILCELVEDRMFP